jgi:hypothetical protein
MTEKELISFCKYYKGEKECPFTDQIKSTFWFYERVWVNDELNCPKAVEEYIDDFALTKVNIDDGVPCPLKALLFNRFHKSSGASLLQDGENFRKFYLENY